MNHRRARKLLNDYLEGDLDREEHARLDEHLSGCDECACEVRELRQTVFLLRDLPTEEPSPGIAEAVMARVQAGDGRPSRWAGLTGRLSDSGGGLALAAGLAALLIVATVGPAEIGQRVVASGGYSGAPAVSLDPDPPVGQRVAVTRPDARSETGNLGTPTQSARPTTLRVQNAASSRNPSRPPGTFVNPVLLPLSRPVEPPSSSIDDRLDALLQNPETFVLQMQRRVHGDRERAVDRLARRASMRGDDLEAVRRLSGVDQPYAPVLARLFESRAQAYRDRSR